MDVHQLTVIFCQKEAAPVLKKFKGLAFGDKGYLGKKIFEELLAVESSKQ